MVSTLLTPVGSSANAWSGEAWPQSISSTKGSLPNGGPTSTSGRFFISSIACRSAASRSAFASASAALRASTALCASGVYSYRAISVKLAPGVLRVNRR